MPETFLDDDHGFERWRWAHPEGFVLSTDRTPSPSRLTVHRANCSTIAGDPPEGGSWTGSSMKVCDRSLEQIQRWSYATTDTAPTECGTCMPRAEEPWPGTDDPARRHPGS